MTDNREEILDDSVVEITDTDGNVYYYVEEMIIPVDGENFAMLVEIDNPDHEHGEDCDCGGECECGCDCGCEDDNVIIAKIVTGEDGEDEYIEPTDEEFAKVQAAYEKLLDEAE